MRKLLILLVLVIVLVSLNWFRELIAGDLGDLSESEKAALLERYAASRPAVGKSGSYHSPRIFDPPEGSGAGAARVQSLSGDTLKETAVRSAEGGEQQDLPPFEELQPFGTGMFDGPRETLPPDDIASDDNYILGPGDNVIVYVWGRVDNEYNLTVDREGKVFIPKVGELIAWGKTLAEFRTQVQKSLSKAYSGFDLTVSLGKIRSIRIYLTGEVKAPGAYTVSSLTSLFNALYQAGGPNLNGSMRSIRLMRSGKAVAEVDLYRFLLEGDNSLDVRLESGDAVFVPVAGARVAVRGEVRRPGVYELKGTATAGDVLHLAGGTNPEAHLERAMLERVSGQRQWQVHDLNLTGLDDGSGPDFILMDGDRLTVFSVFKARKNMVAMFGQVRHPGYYERNDSTRVLELVTRSQLQDYDVYYGRANLFRRHPDWRTEVISLNLRDILDGRAEDILLQDRDSLHVYAIEDVTWDRRMWISGQVQYPGEYPYYDGMTVQDLIFLAGSFTKSALRLQAEIARLDERGDVSIHYVDIGGDPSGSTVLKEGDRVYVRQIPQWKLHRTVTVEGEVAYPGEYVLSSHNESLYSLLERAGGFTPRAFPSGIVFERATIGQSLERLRIPRQLEKSNPLIEDSLGHVKPQAVIEYEAAAVNRIAIDMDLILGTGGGQGDMTLEPGDRIFVPSLPSGISVLGAVGQNGTIRFRENESVKYYVRRAGNFTPRADKKATRLIRANGEVFAGSSTLGRKVQMGDIIVVPTKIQRERNFAKTLGTVLTATTGALTTVLLVTKL
ncbi:MAG TPA: SLBB domain-containing protein [Acidobacteriota bacterium]|nr:SLBB domain-containing protein [Acidobacteriota bacterium]